MASKYNNILPKVVKIQNINDNCLLRQKRRNNNNLFFELFNTHTVRGRLVDFIAIRPHQRCNYNNKLIQYNIP